MYSHPYSLLQAFPWFSRAILDSEGVTHLAQRDSPKTNGYGPAVKTLMKRVESFEKAHRDPSDHETSRTRAFLQADPDGMVQGRLSDFNTMKADKLSNLVSDLLDYRLLDIALFVDQGYDEGISGQPHHLPIPQPAKMHYKQASNWPSLVCRGLQLLHDCDDYSLLTVPTDAGDPTITIFRSLIWRREAVEGHKIMANFECAAAYLSLILKGHSELPGSIPDSKALVSKICEQAPFPTEGFDTFFGCLKSVHSFKLPLQLSLAASPICLFLPSCLMTKDLNRFLLVQIWQGLGGSRPDALLKVELILWRALFDVASGSSPLSHRLRAAFCEIGMVELDRIGYPSSEWLHADPSFHDSFSPQPKDKPSDRSNSKKPASKSKIPFPANNNLSDRVGNNSAKGPSTNASASHRPATRSLTGKPHLRDDAPTKTATNTQTSSHFTRRRRPQKQRAVKDSDHSSSKMDKDRFERESPSGSPHKRAISTGSLGAEHIMKALKLEDGTRKKIYKAIDLTSETLGPLVIDLTIEVSGHDRAICSTPCTIWNLEGHVTYTPRFHFLQEGEWFTSLFKAVKERKYGEIPPFLSRLAASLFTCLNMLQSRQLPIPDMQRKFQEKVLVLPGSAGMELFGEKSLATFCMLDKPVRIQDFSMHPSTDGDEKIGPFLMAINDETETGEVGDLASSVWGAVNIEEIDWMMEGEGGDTVAGNKALLHKEPSGSTVYHGCSVGTVILSSKLHLNLEMQR